MVVVRASETSVYLYQVSHIVERRVYLETGFLTSDMITVSPTTEEISREKYRVTSPYSRFLLLQKLFFRASSPGALFTLLYYSKLVFVLFSHYYVSSGDRDYVY
jgi:hypothetical protein